ncbi:exodeoxyribonuclease VII large subunit [Maricaulis alexandrii]|uniref:exodeoxyribonuclease VII large subunit n=1 Tax=Maricaulis alexandrii TaxID=2570354 RepID=UPI001108357D|nr:exodeoxyribonuclease VII large subunit [Maricaulis alexandrii]
MEQPAGNLHEFSVSELAGSLKRTVEDAFGHVRVRGELGRVVVAKSGHVYFDIKDERAVIASIAWKGTAARFRFRPEEGLEVIIEGKLSTYPGRSQYQLIVESMEPAGAGALMALLEERKRQFAAEGLFDPARKKSIPFLPKTIGVVTSPTGAVIRDILHRLQDRFPRHVLLWPVLVQGEKAAEQIAEAIRGFNALSPDGPVPRPDVLIVARGGGSIEDLWGFNEEIVVRAAADSDIPLISAVGHETDTTLIDFVSDRRAPTPTGAAEMAVPVRAELKGDIDALAARLVSGLSRHIERRRTELRGVVRAMPKPQALLDLKRQRFDMIADKLDSALLNNAAEKRARLLVLQAGLKPEALRRDIRQRRERVADRSSRLVPALQRSMRDQRRWLDTLAGRIESFNYSKILERGFAVVRDSDGAIVRAGSGLAAGSAVELEFADARRQAVIDGTPSETGPAPAAASPAVKSKPKPKPRAKPKSPPAGQGTLF